MGELDTSHINNHWHNKNTNYPEHTKKGNKLLVKHNHNPKVKSIEDTIDKLQKEIEIEIKNNPDIKEFLDLDNEMQNIYEKHRYAQISEDEAHKRLDILEPNWKELMHKTKNERKKLWQNYK